MTEPAPSAPAPKTPKVSPTPPAQGTPPAPPHRWHILHFVTVLLALAGFLTLVLWPRPAANNGTPAAGMDTTMKARLATLERKVATLESRVDDLEARPSAGSSAPAHGAEASTGAVAHLQNDVVSLSAALDALQTEVKRGGQDAARNQRSAQSLFAAAIAFMQLRAAAMSGYGFVNQLAAMRVATRDDPAFAAPLAQLEPYALNGVPSVPALYQQFQDLASSAERAINESAATTWWQRILAELEGLIFIHPVNGLGGANDPLAEIESDVAQGAEGAALNAIQSLPPAATDTLKGWQAEAEARASVDRSLEAMADLLVVSAIPPKEPAAASPQSSSHAAPAASDTPDAP